MVDLHPMLCWMLIHIKSSSTEVKLHDNLKKKLEK